MCHRVWRGVKKEKKSVNWGFLTYLALFKTKAFCQHLNRSSAMYKWCFQSSSCLTELLGLLLSTRWSHDERVLYCRETFVFTTLNKFIHSLWKQMISVLQNMVSKYTWYPILNFILWVRNRPNEEKKCLFCCGFTFEPIFGIPLNLKK